MIIRDAVRHAIRQLQAAGVDGARQDAWLLLGQVLQWDRATLMAHASDPLGLDDHGRFQNLLNRRVRREPLAQILGRKEFWSLDFQISADVLCPRPDSECLIEAALAFVGNPDRSGEEPFRILDLGTGSGCLLLTLLREWPGVCGVGVDISHRALQVAQSNAERLGQSDRAGWLCGNWGNALDERFDLIVSNPPYVTTGEASLLAPEVRDYEPAAALFAGADGLDAYRSIAPDVKRLLLSGGLALIEVGHRQAAPVESLFRDAGLKPMERRQDLAGIDRCLVFRRP